MVLPGLYLGSFRDGKDSEQLRVNDITHIVSIHDAAKEVVEDKKYLCIRVPDSPDENLTRYFPRCNDFIHSARMDGGNVLVHCLAGVSRSATIAAAYIMSVTNLNCKDALKVIRGARTIANPNYGFHSQLKEFESYTLTSERKRLKIRYKTFDNRKLDEEECAKMITVYHSNTSMIPSNNSTPSHSYNKNSTSACTTPVTSPFHRQSRIYSRSSPSAISSPSSSPVHRPKEGYSQPSTSASYSPGASPIFKRKPSTSTSYSPGTSPVLRRKPSIFASYTPESSPVHKPSPSSPTISVSYSPGPSPAHKRTLSNPSTSAAYSPGPSPLHTPTLTPFQSIIKPSTSAGSSPSLTPVHIPIKSKSKPSTPTGCSLLSPLRRLKFRYRSASSSPKRS